MKEYCITKMYLTNEISKKNFPLLFFFFALLSNRGVVWYITWPVT